MGQNKLNRNDSLHASRSMEFGWGMRYSWIPGRGWDLMYLEAEHSIYSQKPLGLSLLPQPCSFLTLLQTRNKSLEILGYLGSRKIRTELGKWNYVLGASPGDATSLLPVGKPDVASVWINVCACQQACLWPLFVKSERFFPSLHTGVCALVQAHHSPHL